MQYKLSTPFKQFNILVSRVFLKAEGTIYYQLKFEPVSLLAKNVGYRSMPEYHNNYLTKAITNGEIEACTPALQQDSLDFLWNAKGMVDYQTEGRQINTTSGAMVVLDHYLIMECIEDFDSFIKGNFKYST